MEIVVDPFGKLAAARIPELSAAAERLAASLGVKPSVMLAA
jgi:hypothetical protein